MTVVVTGTGRCGTEWCARTLVSAGIRAGHQAVVRHEHVLGRTPIDWTGFDVEVSYEAAPIAGKVAERVVLVTRHPYRVAPSWVALGAFDDDSGYDDLHDSIRVHAPHVLDDPDPMVRALRFWAAWNLLAAAQADAVIRIEVLDPSTLVELVGVPASFPPAEIARDLNHRREFKRPVVAPTEPCDGLAPIAERFGYPL